VDDDLILFLFRRIEALSDDASDPYHYAIIRVLVRLLTDGLSYSSDDYSLY